MSHAFPPSLSLSVFLLSLRNLTLTEKSSSSRVNARCTNQFAYICGYKLSSQIFYLKLIMHQGVIGFKVCKIVAIDPVVSLCTLRSITSNRKGALLPKYLYIGFNNLFIPEQDFSYLICVRKCMKLFTLTVPCMHSDISASKKSRPSTTYFTHIIMHYKHNLMRVDHFPL